MPKNLKPFDKSMLKAMIQHPLNKKIVANGSVSGNGPFQNTTSKDDNIQTSGSPTGIPLGTAWFDQQTSGNMPRRVLKYTSGNIDYFHVFVNATAPGTTGKTQFNGTNPTYASLGSYYQLFDGSATPIAPQFNNWQRVESRASQMGSAYEFPNGYAGLISNVYPLSIAAASSIDLQVFSNPNMDQTFAQDTVTGSSRFYSRSATDGNGNIHLLYQNRYSNLPNFNEIGYRRSTDNGNTWTTEQIISGPNAFDGALPSSAGPDTYVIDAQGNNVLMVYIDKYLALIFRKSTDNGVTWSQPQSVFNFAYDTIYVSLDSHTGDYVGVTDSVLSPGLVMDAIVDNGGNMHFVVNVVNTALRGTVTQDNTGKTIFVDSTAYFIDTHLFYPSVGFVYINVPSDPNIQGSSFAVGPPSGKHIIDPNLRESYGVYTPYPYIVTGLDSLPGAQYVSDPQLSLDDIGNVYLTYTSVCDSMNTNLDQDIKTLKFAGRVDTLSAYYRHIYAQRLDIANKTASDAVDMTPFGWDCAYPSVSKFLSFKNGEYLLPIAYIADQDPWNFFGFGIQVGNNVIITSWAQEFSTLTSEPKAYFDLFPLKGYDGVTDNPVDNANATFQVYPNPVSGTANINCNITRNSNVSVALYNLLGEKVMDIYNGNMEIGTRSLSFTTNGLPAGFYLCRLTQGGTQSTQSVVVE
jgi:hypothetical protein